MSALDEILTDAFRRHEEGAALVRATVEREGATAVVRAVARLVGTRAPRHGEALLFLTDGEEIPELVTAIEADPELAQELQAMLVQPAVRDRRTAIWALGRLNVRDRFDTLERAVRTFLAEKEIISLASALTTVYVPDVVDHLVASDDWLLRWTALPWLNEIVDSPMAADIRRRLAFDDHPLVAAEAHQHLCILEEYEARAATTMGWSFAVLSNHGPATAFRSVASEFLESWPADKTTYDLEELRAFVTRT